MDFDLRLIRYLVALSEAPSFTEAAAALHVSQPALSQGIKRLERIVGAPLIDRVGKGFTRGATLTGAGEIVLAAGRSAMSDLDRAFILARAEASRLEVRIGFGSTTPRALSTGIIEMLSRLGDPDISLKFLSWGEEIEQLLRGDVGMAFLHMAPDFEDDALLIEHVCYIERVAVFAAGHPLAGADGLTMADLLDEPILEAATGDRDFWVVDPREGGRAPVVVGPATRTVDEMLAFVAAGKGMAITTVSVAENNRSPAVSFVPVSDLQPAAIRLVMNPGDNRRGVRPLFDKVHAEAVAVLQRP